MVVPNATAAIATAKANTERNLENALEVYENCVNESLMTKNHEWEKINLGDAENFFKEGSGGSFLSDISIVREKYIIKIKENSESFFSLKLIPKRKTPEIQSILIIVSKQTYNIQKIITSNIYEDTIELGFHNIEFKNIDDSVFEFIIPENTSVIDIDN